MMVDYLWDASKDARGVFVRFKTAVECSTISDELNLSQGCSDAVKVAFGTSPLVQPDIGKCVFLERKWGNLHLHSLDLAWKD